MPVLGFKIPSLRCFKLGLVFWLVQSGVCFAATISWNGGPGGADANWSTDQNWNPNGDPAVGSDLDFLGSSRLTNTINTGSGVTLKYNSILFDANAAGSFLIGGGTVTNGVGGITVNSQNFIQQMTNTSIVFSGSQSWNAASNVFLTTANIDLSTFTLSVNGATNVVINGGLISGTGGITKTGIGVLILTNGNANTFSGGLTVNAGRVTIDKSLGLGTGTLTMNGGEFYHENNMAISNAIVVTANSVFTVLNGADDNITGSISGTAGTTLSLKDIGTTGHAMQIFSDGNIIDFDIDLDADSRIRMLSNDPSKTNTFNGRITGTGTTGVNNGAFNTTSNGVNILMNSNTFTGSTTIRMGLLIIQTNHALGTIAQGTYVTNGGSLGFRGGFTYAAQEAIQVSQSGVGGNGTIQNLGGTNVFMGVLTNTTDTRYFTESGQLILSGFITNLGSELAITNAANSSLMLSNVLAGGVGIHKSGAGTLILARTNVFTGYLTNAGGTVESQKQNSLLGLNTIVMQGGAMGITTVNQTNGQAFTLASRGGWNIASNITNTLTGVVSGTGSMEKLGAGVLVIQGNNTFSGNFTNTLGTTVVNHANALGAGAKNLSVNGGTLLFNLGVTNTSAKVQLSGGALEQSDMNVSLGQLQILSGSSINLAKDGSDGRFTFDGATNIGGGTLSITGWVGDETGGTGDLIFFTSTATMTSTFFNNVTFAPGYVTGAFLLPTGELVPITPEPATMLSGISLLLGFLGRVIRNRFRRG